MKKLTYVAITAAILTGCGSDSSSDKTPALTDGYDTEISSIQLDADNRLWLSIGNADSPAIAVYDTDTNSQNGERISLTMPTSDIEFLDNGQYVAQLVAADYSSSQVATGSQSGSRTATESLLVVDKSDYIVESYGNSVYHIGRFQVDEISKYNAEVNLTDAVWQYSANAPVDQGDTDSANVHAFIQESATKAYVLRYGSTLVWQVNPQATSEENFVTDTIDLAAYTVEGAPAPRAHAAAIANGRLYIALQRLDSSWQPQQPYIAVINTADNTEIDTAPDSDGLKGVALNTRNPNSVQIQGDYLYIQGRGAYNAESHGSIDRVNLTDFSVEAITDDSTFSYMNANLDDDDADNDVGFHVTGMAVVSDTEMYLTVTQEQGFTTLNTRVAEFNPNTRKLVELIEVPRN